MILDGTEVRSEPGASPPPARLSRRGFLGLASAAVGLWVPRGWASPAGGDPGSPSPFEREHLPVLRMPTTTTNGSKVPIVVELSQPMTPDHHVTTIQVVNRRDPVPLKGTFHFTPANGQAYVAFQTRIHHGVSEVSVTAECNRHGKWSTSQAIDIPDHAGG